MTCGSGRDTLLQPAPNVVVPAGCERVEPWWLADGALRIPPTVRARAVRLRVPNPCLWNERRHRCRVTGMLLVAGRHAAAARVRWRSVRGGTRTLRWTLSPRERRRLRRGAVLTLRLELYEQHEGRAHGGYSVVLG